MIWTMATVPPPKLPDSGTPSLRVFYCHFFPDVYNDPMAKGRWTEADDRNLRAWLAEGLTLPRIAVRLGRTLNSVSSRCKHFGLSAARKTLGQPLAVRAVSQTTGTKQIVEVPAAEPLMLKVPPSA